ncbi:MAG: hypothetical protein IKW26_11300 [Treponema sp.]|nr:hypothetical protein [Treponema sp.]
MRFWQELLDFFLIFFDWYGEAWLLSQWTGTYLKRGGNNTKNFPATSQNSSYVTSPILWIISLIIYRIEQGKIIFFL